MMEKDSLSDQLSCPCCGRDYELPRRYLIHLDDYDFSPIPRLLPCLHSMCHSCLQEQFEKTNNQSIECNLCHHQEIIKGVNYLPLDLCILKQIVNTTSTELLATCSKCYDIVPSVSWCETCSSALCEFHHQDHKLSIETSKHSFNTFKEYFYQQKHIEYHFPPISCPECILQDCEYYCCHCYHLISSKAFIEYHQGHPIQSTEDIFPKMKKNLETSIQSSKQSIEELQNNIQKIKEYLNQLDENEENHLLNIHKNFNLMYSHLKSREKELITNFTSSISQERKKLLTQLSNLVEIMEDYQQVTKISNQFLTFANVPSVYNQRKSSGDGKNEGKEQATTGSSSPRHKKSQNIYDNVYEPMYLIAVSDTIEDRCDYLQNILKEKIEYFHSQVIPLYSVEFQSQDINVIHGTINCLGAMNEYPYLAERKENIPVHPNLVDESQEKNQIPSSEKGGGFHDENFGTIHYSINIGDNTPNPPKQPNSKNSNLYPSQNSKQNLVLTPSRSKAALADNAKELKHSLFIETRWIPPKTYPLPLIPDHHKLHPNQSPHHGKSSATSNTNEPETETYQTKKEKLSALEESPSFQGIIEMYNKIFSEGILLGRIEMNEKVIKKLNERLRYKTYFESRKQDNTLNHNKSASALHQAINSAMTTEKNPLPAESSGIHFESKTISYLSITKELSIE